MQTAKATSLITKEEPKKKTKDHTGFVKYLTEVQSQSKFEAEMIIKYLTVFDIAHIHSVTMFAQSLKILEHEAATLIKILS